MSEKSIEEQKIENELELEMLSSAISKNSSRLQDVFDEENKDDDIKEMLERVKKIRILLNKYEKCLKLVK